MFQRLLRSARGRKVGGVMRIAMWSGPRNLSTAMMYAFAQRSDCAVWDEPFYAAFLAASGIDHPLRDESLAAGEVDPARVSTACAGLVPGGKPHWYQKHMTHHMLPAFPLDWFGEVRHAFLIRHPARVVASYVKKRETPTRDDIGFWQQAQLFDHVTGQDAKPVVIDSATVREDPEAALTALCEALGIGFDPAMLSWPAGGNPADGAWAPHWYGAIHRSTGFAGAEGPLPDLAGAHLNLAQEALPHYERLAALALKP